MKTLLFTGLALLVVAFSSNANSNNNKNFKILEPNEKPCSGQELTLTTNSGPDFTFHWYPENLFDNPTQATVKAKIKRTTVVHVIRTNKHGISDTAYYTIAVNEIKAEIFGEKVLCEGDSIELIIPTQYANTTWSNGEKGHHIWVKKPGIYRVEALQGCDYVAGEIHISSMTKPLALITTFDDLEVCKGEEVKLAAFGVIDRFEWSTGHDSREISIVGEKDEDITLTVKNKCGVSTDTKSIKVQEVDADFILSKLEGEAPFELKLMNESKQTAKNLWYVNGELVSEENSPTVLIEEPGEYDITLERKTDKGCTQKMTYRSVAVAPAPQPISSDKLVLLPNSFTPNGDGLNDKLEFYSNFIHDIHFVVFDRWGHAIYEGEGSNGWDGRLVNGELAPQGMYVIQYDYRDLQGEPVNKVTSLNLMR
jgi:gliding motility-associated-like protein